MIGDTWCTRAERVRKTYMERDERRTELVHTRDTNTGRYEYRRPEGPTMDDDEPIINLVRDTDDFPVMPP